MVTVSTTGKSSSILSGKTVKSLVTREATFKLVEIKKLFVTHSFQLESYIVFPRTSQGAEEVF